MNEPMIMEFLVEPIHGNRTTDERWLQTQNRNGEDGELHQLSQHRECKESRRPKSDENSEAFGVRLLFSGFAFLDVPDENGAKDRNETECRECNCNYVHKNNIAIAKQ